MIIKNNPLVSRSSFYLHINSTTTFSISQLLQNKKSMAHSPLCSPFVVHTYVVYSAQSSVRSFLQSSHIYSPFFRHVWKLCKLPLFDNTWMLKESRANVTKLSLAKKTPSFLLLGQNALLFREPGVYWISMIFLELAYITWDPKYFQYAYSELSNRNSSEPSEPQKIGPSVYPPQN